MRTAATFLTLLLIPAGVCLAQTPQTAPAAELCEQHIDPYNPMRVRSAFFNAAGVDGELSNDEFNTDRERHTGFVQPFDNFPAMLGYDGNANGTIDWTEAERYRQNLRWLVLGRFDTDRNGRLMGPEREQANRALVAGQINPAQRGQDPRLRGMPTGPAPGETLIVGQEQPGSEAGPGAAGGDPQDTGRMSREDMVARYDTDGDGQLTGEERREAFRAMAEQRRRQMVEQYDTDGDGELNEAEQQAAREAMREQMQQRARQWRESRMDTDGDGQVSEAERAAAEAERAQQQTFRSSMETGLFDTNGDGEVTDEERQQVGQQLRQQFSQWREEFQQQMDTDGDGEISRDERREFGQAMRERMEQRTQEYVDRYDTDGDGLLSEDEREQLAAGLRQEWQDRRARFDTDGDGQLTGEEMNGMLEELRDDWVGGGPRGGPRGDRGPRNRSEGDPPGQGFGPQRDRALDQPRQPRDDQRGGGFGPPAENQSQTEQPRRGGNRDRNRDSQNSGSSLPEDLPGDNIQDEPLE